MPFAFIYFTAANPEETLRIGRVLVEERLAACVNALGAMTSVYRWKGAVQEDTEAAAIAKTRTELVPQVTRRIQELHTYDCPCVVSWEIENGSAEFLAWIREQTTDDPETNA